MSDQHTSTLENAVSEALDLQGAERERFMELLREANAGLHERVARLLSRQAAAERDFQCFLNAFASGCS